MKWINIKDKNPNKQTDVLFTDSEIIWIGWINSEGKIRESVLGCTDDNCRYIDDTCCCDLTVVVTHWMPLPLSPSEENTAKNFPICDTCCLPIDPKIGHPSYCGK